MLHPLVFRYSFFVSDCAYIAKDAGSAAHCLACAVEHVHVVELHSDNHRVVLKAGSLISGPEIGISPFWPVTQALWFDSSPTFGLMGMAVRVQTR